MAAITLPTAGLLNAGPGVLQCAMLLIGGDDQGSAVDVEFDAQETLAVCNVPANCFIDHVSCVTETAWTASVTLDLGDGDDADGFLASAKVAPTTAVTTGILKSSVRATAEAYGVGKLYPAPRGGGGAARAGGAGAARGARAPPPPGGGPGGGPPPAAAHPGGGGSRVQ